MNITDESLYWKGQFYCRNFGIESCGISVSVGCEPTFAVMTQTYCFDLESEARAIVSLLQYVNQQIPSITEFHFKDESYIDCDVRPIPLHYFSIAFNGKTWFENRFQAKPTNNTAYRERIQTLLFSTSKMDFLQFCSIAAPPQAIILELEQYYEKADTIGCFFNSIPEQDRYRLVRDWLYMFMSHFLRDVVETTDWIIQIPIILSTDFESPTGKISFYNPIRNLFMVSPEDV